MGEAWQSVGTRRLRAEAGVGAAQGFQPADLTLIRFGVAGLVMLPLLARAGHMPGAAQVRLDDGQIGRAHV